MAKIFLPHFSTPLRSSLLARPPPPPLAMRLNLQVPPSAAVAGQAAGLCLALCLNLHPAGVLPALADDGTSGAAVCLAPVLSLGQSSHPAPRPGSPSQATHTHTVLGGAGEVQVPAHRQEEGRPL